MVRDLLRTSIPVPPIQMYSAMNLSVNGVRSKLSKPSNLDTVPLLSEALTEKTLNVEGLLLPFGLWVFNKREFHILVVMVCLAWRDLLDIPIWHCMGGTSIWAIFPFYLSPTAKMEMQAVLDKIQNENLCETPKLNSPISERWCACVRMLDSHKYIRANHFGKWITKCFTESKGILLLF